MHAATSRGERLEDAQGTEFADENMKPPLPFVLPRKEASDPLQAIQIGFPDDFATKIAGRL